EYSMHIVCFKVDLKMERVMPLVSPSWYNAETMRRLRRWKYACQSMASSLSAQAMCQMAAPGQVTVGKPLAAARREYSVSSHLMNSGSGWPLVSATMRGNRHIHHPLYSTSTRRCNARES